LKRFLLLTSLLVNTALFTQAQSAKQNPGDGAAIPSVRFYPNPATTFVTFEFERAYDKGYSIQVFNFLGRKVYESANLNPRTTVNLTDFTRGVYIYQIRNRQGKMVETGKFQVSK
jgi:hypothetical protein